jgi:O-antigen ligase
MFGYSAGYTDVEKTLFNNIPSTIGPLFPRVSGGLIDPNVGAFFLIFLFFLMKAIQYTNKLVYVAILILVVLSLSKSAIILFFLSSLLIQLFSLNFEKKLPRIKIKSVLFILCFIGIAFYFISNNSEIVKETFVNGAQARFENADGSNDVHSDLIDLAIEKITNNPINLFLGYGFGTSPELTKTIWGDDKYGNFHSEFLTIWVELGIIGLLVYLIIICYPLMLYIFFIKGIKIIIVVFFYATFFIINIYYQEFIFPYYLFSQMFFWFYALNSNYITSK